MAYLIQKLHFGRKNSKQVVLTIDKYCATSQEEAAERRKGEWDNGRGQQAAAAKSPCKPSSQLAGFKSLNAQNCLRTFTFRYKIKLKNNISFIISTKIMIYTFIQAEKCIFFHYEFPPIFEKIRLFINRLDTLDSRTIL